jgi:hypothetical protein
MMVTPSRVVLAHRILHALSHTNTISMKKLITVFTTALIVILCKPNCFAQEEADLWESKGPHVRIKRNDQDGSYVVFERSPDDRRLVKTTKDQNDSVKMKATYLRNQKGFLTVGRIHDGQGIQIYRVQYGYDKETGLLVAENMYDARVKNYYPPAMRDENGQLVEMPVRRVYYFYDADGNQSKAISLVPNPGKTAQATFKKTKKPLDLFGQEKNFNTGSSTNPLKDNPFVEEKKTKK